MKLSLAVVLLAVAACHPTPPAPMPPDASDAGYVGDAASSTAVCEHLAELGCDEGRAPNCAATLDHAQRSRLTDLRPTCLLAAPTKAAARACKSVTCP